MLELHYIREHADRVKDNIRRRHKEDKVRLVDELLATDKKWREGKGGLERVRARRNLLSEEINKAKKAGKDAKALLSEAAELPKKIGVFEEDVSELQRGIQNYLYRIPNMMHESVPLGKSEAENVEVKKVGKPKKVAYELKTHMELAEGLGIADFEQGAIVAGKGFNYISGKLALLDLALQRYGIDFLVKKG